MENYLKLQQLRFDNRITYSIEIDPEVDLEKIVPKMIIHTFAENAVKHGLAYKDSVGEVRVWIIQEKQNLVIEVSDNGIGRMKAEELGASSTGKGHEIIDQIIGIYNKLQKSEVNYRIEDLFDENGSVGSVRVKVVIPV